MDGQTTTRMAPSNRMQIDALLNDASVELGTQSPSPAPEASSHETSSASSSLGSPNAPIMALQTPAIEDTVAADSMDLKYEDLHLSTTRRQQHPQLHVTQNSRPRTGRGSRQFRPSYGDEESFFIWYHRLDLGLEWPEIVSQYNSRFQIQRAGCQGIQCKFYRFVQSHGVPSVRKRQRDPRANEKYALRRWRPGVRYHWMRGQSRL